MKRTLSLVVCVCALTGIMAAQAGQTTTPRRTRTKTTTTTTVRTSTAKTNVAAEIQQMKAMLQQQQQEIEELKQQLATRDQSAQQAQQQAAAAASAAQQASSKADTAATQAAAAQDAANSLKSDVSDVQAKTASVATAVQEEQKKVTDMVESPLAIRYKGVTLTPGGFLAAETIYRSHGTGADVATPYNAIPLIGAGAYHNSEFFGSGRQSRITLLAEGKIKSAKLSGFYELDWLGSAVTSNNNASNSYVNRQRQLWGQVALDSGWTLTGGQMWSLVTETKKGLDNRTEALPSTWDPNYHIGFSWARQFAFRVVRNFNNKAWFGFALENPQTTLTAHGNASNFALGIPGNTVGLYNSLANYSLNVFPDIVVKGAFEPGWGHFEIFGVVSQFRDRIYPSSTSAAGASNDHRTGGGIGANARGTLAKKVDLGLHLFGGDGVGRYGASGFPDATVRPDGTLSLIHVLNGLGTVEIHTPRVDWFFNAGAEYAGRTWYLNSAGKPVGYGAPGFVNTSCDTEALPSAGSGFAFGVPPAATCTGDTRVTIQGTLGFAYKFYNGPKGRIQWGPQYSHLVRNTWSGTGGAPGTSLDMFYTSLRYYLP